MYHLHKQRSHMLCLEETHLHKTHLPSFCNKYYPVWCHRSSEMGKTRGIAIFFHKSLLIQILDVKTDSDAWYISNSNVQFSS